MAFSNLSFVFFFLPLCLILYYLAPKKIKPGVMLLASLVFYAWTGLNNLLVLVLVIVFNWAAGLEIYYLKGRDRLLWEGPSSFRLTLSGLSLAVSVILNVLVLALYKYTSLAMPLGVSFFLFSAISYLADIFNGDFKPRTNPFYCALYLSFFPKVTMGPIVRYQDMADQMVQPQLTADNLTEGALLFMTGLFKKVLLADTLSKSFASCAALSSTTVLSSWLGMIFYGLQLYFDFSGYSDMAIGLSRMFGFNSRSNFNYPYLAAGLSDFWRRWHITLGAWFRDYVYIPLGGSRVSVPRHLFNLMAVWILTGLWHGSTWNYLLWGLYNGLIIILDKYVVGKALSKAPRFVQILLTDLVVFVGWIFFFSPNAASAFTYMGQLFGAQTVSFSNAQALLILKENLPLLVLSLLCAGPAMLKIRDLICRRQKIGTAVITVCYAVLFVISIAFMVSSTYSTFLYFKF